MPLRPEQTAQLSHARVRYHPWNDKHRKVLKAYGAAPPPPDPFYEEIKARPGKARPGSTFRVGYILACLKTGAPLPTLKKNCAIYFNPVDSS